MEHTGPFNPFYGGNKSSIKKKKLGRPTVPNLNWNFILWARLMAGTIFSFFWTTPVLICVSNKRPII